MASMQPPSQPLTWISAGGRRRKTQYTLTPSVFPALERSGSCDRCMLQPCALSSLRVTAALSWQAPAAGLHLHMQFRVVAPATMAQYALLHKGRLWYAVEVSALRMRLLK